VIFRVIHTIQFRLLASMYLIRLPTGRDFALSADHRDARPIAILVDVDTKRPRFLHSKRKVRRVDFIQVAFSHFAHSKVHCTFRDTRLQNVFVQVQERKRSHATQMHRRLARLQLRARILIRPELIANSHRAILRRSRPIFCPSRLERYTSIQVADPSYSRWRVAFFGSRLGRD
jgi:hypothetical protein